MLGPLHTEMTYLSVLGDWLEKNGWKTIVQNAGLTRSGVAESLLSGKDVVRTKYTYDSYHMGFGQYTAYTIHNVIIKGRFPVKEMSYNILNSDVGQLY